MNNYSIAVRALRRIPINGYYALGIVSREFMDYSGTTLKHVTFVGSLKLILRKCSACNYLAVVIKIEPLNSPNDCNITNLFENETLFYEAIVKWFEHICNEKQITSPKFYPIFYGSHKVANREVIVLQNLYQKGYLLGDRFDGFDVASAAAVLTKLGVFHGTSIALRMNCPETFNLIRDQIKPTEVPKDLAQEEKLLNEIIAIAEENVHCANITRSILENLMHSSNTNLRDEFVTLIHNELWVYNILTNTHDDGSITDVKFIDFQQICVDSVVKDLLFFIFTSINLEVVEIHYNELLRIYHKALVSTLEHFTSETSQFSYEKLLEELKAYAPGLLIKLLEFMFYMFVIHEELFKLGEDEYLVQRTNILSLQKERMWFIMTQYTKRNWL